MDCWSFRIFCRGFSIIISNEEKEIDNYYIVLIFQKYQCKNHIKVNSVLDFLKFYIDKLIILVLKFLRMERSLTHCEIIPNRLIMKNSQHAYRKILINKKFQWLNKYLCAESPKLINPDKLISFSHMQPEKNRQKIQSYVVSKSQSRDITNHTKSDMIKTKYGRNRIDHRKTNSSALKYKGSQSKENGGIFRTVHKKKENIDNFCSKKISMSEQKRGRVSILNVEEFEIQPWEYDENEDMGILKMNKNRLNTHY